MKLIGVTGGIGMGKSTAGRLLAQQGVAVIDADTIARQLVEPGQPALEEIGAQFGPHFILENGALDRAALAREVFAHSAARLRLEAILHPRIRAVWAGEVEGWRASGRAWGAVVIPLLFEIRGAAAFDSVITAACSGATQSMRLADRGWDAAQCKQRLDSQWPIERKIALADFVVWSDTTLENHAEQLRRILSAMDSGGRAGQAKVS